ncbi:ABC transporter ATP-binding protein, partial [Streptococcus pneumoniae]
MRIKEQTININGGIKNVSKHYGHSIILKDINFALNKGEIV